jgi:hypothetical protein
MAEPTAKTKRLPTLLPEIRKQSMLKIKSKVIFYSLHPVLQSPKDNTAPCYCI